MIERSTSAHDSRVLLIALLGAEEGEASGSGFALGSTPAAIRSGSASPEARHSTDRAAQRKPPTDGRAEAGGFATGLIAR